MSLSWSLVLLSALVLMLGDISTATQSPAPSPTYLPKKKTPVPSPTPVTPPVASPAPMVPDVSAPGPSTTGEEPDCMTLLFGAVDCLSYVEEGSNLTAPDKGCCPELATLVSSNPICLCELLKKGNGIGIPIDMTRALALPAACKVATPDPALCALVNGSPTGAPGASPSGKTSYPTSSDGLAPTGESLAPTSVNNDNGDAVVGASASSLLVTVVAGAAFAWNMF